MFDVLFSIVSNDNFSFLILCVNIWNGSVFLSILLGSTDIFRSILDLLVWDICL